MEIVTMKQRFEYLKGVFEVELGIDINFPVFMECIFTKLEEEIRSKKIDLGKYAGHKTVKSEDFEYDYDT
uniref:Uncharacterized protein n=1 Tax=viral metagenome TaxID=1070528 RepID=A0A6H1ZER2_9ZZZZ